MAFHLGPGQILQILCSLTSLLPHSDGALLSEFTATPDNGEGTLHVAEGEDVNMTWQYNVASGETLVDIIWGLWDTSSNPPRIYPPLIIVLSGTLWYQEKSGAPDYYNRTKWFGGASFQLMNVNRTVDQRKFGCKLYFGPFGSKQDEFTLDVQVGPFKEVTPLSEVTCTEGSICSLGSCKASGDPTPNVTWIHAGQQLNKSSGEASLQLMSPTRHDHSNEYWCYANNDVTNITVGSTTILVNYIATIDLSQSSTSTKESWIGHTVSLYCKFLGLPKPQITWFPLPFRYVITEVDGLSQLNITTAGSNDFGIYTCRGNNTLGNTQYTMGVHRLFLPDSPEISSVSAKVHSLSVTWTKPSYNGGAEITKYSVKIRQKGDSSWSSSNTFPYVLTQLIDNLSQNTSYQVCVSAWNKVGEGNCSVIKENTTHTYRVLETPGAPVIINNGTNIDKEELTLRWNRPPRNGREGDITHYIVHYRHTDDDGIWDQWIKVNITGAQTQHYTLHDLVRGKDYQFRVYAWNTVGRDTSSNTWRVTVMTECECTQQSHNTPASTRWKDVFIGVLCVLVLVLVLVIVGLVLARNKPKCQQIFNKQKQTTNTDSQQLGDYSTSGNNNGNQVSGGINGNQVSGGTNSNQVSGHTNESFYMELQEREPSGTTQQGYEHVNRNNNPSDLRQTESNYQSLNPTETYAIVSPVANATYEPLRPRNIPQYSQLNLESVDENNTNNSRV